LKALRPAGQLAFCVSRPKRFQGAHVSGSRFSDAFLPSPPTVLAAEVREPFDVVLLGCQAHDLEAAIDAFAPAAATSRGAGRIRC